MWRLRGTVLLVAAAAAGAAALALQGSYEGPAEGWGAGGSHKLQRSDFPALFARLKEMFEAAEAAKAAVSRAPCVPPAGTELQPDLSRLEEWFGPAEEVETEEFLMDASVATDRWDLQKVHKDAHMCLSQLPSDLLGAAVLRSDTAEALNYTLKTLGERFAEGGPLLLKLAKLLHAGDFAASQITRATPEEEAARKAEMLAEAGIAPETEGEAPHATTTPTTPTTPTTASPPASSSGNSSAVGDSATPSSSDPVRHAKSWEGGPTDVGFPFTSREAAVDVRVFSFAQVAPDSGCAATLFYTSPYVHLASFAEAFFSSVAAAVAAHLRRELPHVETAVDLHPFYPRLRLVARAPECAAVKAAVAEFAEYISLAKDAAGLRDDVRERLEKLAAGAAGAAGAGGGAVSGASDGASAGSAGGAGVEAAASPVSSGARVLIDMFHSVAFTPYISDRATRRGAAAFTGSYEDNFDIFTRLFLRYGFLDLYVRSGAMNVEELKEFAGHMAGGAIMDRLRPREDSRVQREIMLRGLIWQKDKKPQTFKAETAGGAKTAGGAGGAGGAEVGPLAPAAPVASDSPSLVLANAPAAAAGTPAAARPQSLLSRKLFSPIRRSLAAVSSDGEAGGAVAVAGARSAAVLPADTAPLLLFASAVSALPAATLDFVFQATNYKVLGTRQLPCTDRAGLRALACLASRPAFASAAAAALGAPATFGVTASVRPFWLGTEYFFLSLTLPDGVKHVRATMEQVVALLGDSVGENEETRECVKDAEAAFRDAFWLTPEETAGVPAALALDAYFEEKIASRTFLFSEAVSCFREMDGNLSPDVVRRAFDRYIAAGAPERRPAAFFVGPKRLLRDRSAGLEIITIAAQWKDVVRRLFNVAIPGLWSEFIGDDYLREL